LVDRLALIDKIPPARWTPVQALGVVTSSGGFSSIACDVATQEGVAIHPFEESLAWVQERVPGIQVSNPLDVPLTSSIHWRDIMDHYITAPDLDACFILQPMLTESEILRTWIKDIAENADKVFKPVVLADVSDVPPEWIRDLESDSLAYGRGVRPSMRGLQTIGAFIRYRERQRSEVDAPNPIARPAAATIKEEEGEALPFDATMQLLREAGIPAAPYMLLDIGTNPDEAQVPFPEPYVVKLADIAHRTEHDAVRLNVSRSGLAAAVSELREIARADGLPLTVAIQPHVPSAGEVLIGIQGMAELGPVVAFGLGGIFVEALNRVSGRIAPFDVEEARDLIEEFRDVKIMHGFRGRAAWDLEELARILVNVSRLAAAGRDWIASLDLNPVLYGDGGWSAVDAVLFVRPS
jgi:acyl-CoA synthetase (NDP forming)